MYKARNRKQKSFPEPESFSISLCFIDVIWEFYDPSKQNKPTIPSVRDVVSSRRKFKVLDFIILLTMAGMIARKLLNVNKTIQSSGWNQLVNLCFAIQEGIRTPSTDTNICTLAAIQRVIPFAANQAIVACHT